MSAAYRVPTIPAALYQQYGETAVNVASRLGTLLYAARSRLDLMRDCAEHGEASKAAEHGRRAIEYSAEIRATMKRHGQLGQIAFRLAKQMEGPRA
jgi:hypothetical protein